MTDTLDDILGPDPDDEPAPAVGFDEPTPAERRGRARALHYIEHPDYDHPGPDDPDLVPDDARDLGPDERPPLVFVRFDRLPIEDPPEAGLLFLPDGKGLFYAGAVNSIAGDPGAGKTFAALLAVVAAVRAGHAALIIDYEDTNPRLRQRLVALGLTDAELALVYGIDRLDQILPDDLDQILDLLAEQTIRVVVIDSVTPALESQGLDENAGHDFSKWLRHIAQPLAWSTTQPVVNLIDHRAKPPTNVRGMLVRGLWAVGSRHKLAGIDGVAYVLESIAPFSRSNPGAMGKLDLIVAKDRHGAIGARGDIVARFELTPTTTGAIDHDIRVPDAKAERDADGGRLTPLERILGRRDELLPLIHELWDLDSSVEPGALGLSTNRVRQWLTTLPLEKKPGGAKLGFRPGDLKDALYAWADGGYLTHTLGPRSADLWRPNDATVSTLFEPAPPLELDPDFDPNEEPF